MSSTEELLRSALLAHKAGRLTEAEVGYSRVLRKRPADPHALYGLSLLSFHSGARDQGIQYLRRSLESAPRNGRGWITLGSMLIETGRDSEAKGAYRRATQVSPELPDGWYNVGICLKREGDFNGAIGQLRRAVGCAVPFSQAYDALAALLYEQGRFHEAAQTLADWAVREPANPKAQHMGAAASANETPSRASDAYVREHFDAFADGFDRTLAELNYRAPQLVAEALRQYPDGRPAAAAVQAATSQAGTAQAGTSALRPRWQAVLDAGCGTGLCGPLVRPLCHTLVGVDLSPKMLGRAQTRGCYDELVTAELAAFMRSRPGRFDAIVCADTLVYFGGLEEPLAAARETLRPGGPLIFTVEALTAAADHKLELTGRYLHSEPYLRRALAGADLALDSLTPHGLREERSESVPGYLVVAHRA